VEKLHPDYNRAYYVNRATGESVWEAPTEGFVSMGDGGDGSGGGSGGSTASPTERSRSRSIQIQKFGDWVKMEDPIEKSTSEKRIFYQNERTQEVTYNKPKEWSLDTTGTTTTTDTINTTDATKTHRGTDEMDPTAISVDMRRRSMVQQEEGHWSHLLDPTTKREFYYNKKTKVSQWNRPMSFPMRAQRNKIRKEVDLTTRRSSVVVEDTGGDWVRMEDKHSKKTFYYNRTNEATQWEKPFGKDEEHQGGGVVVGGC
jgi:hypothetical protein